LNASVYFVQQISKALGNYIIEGAIDSILMPFRRELFQHMYQTHHFNIGSPENMVHINELLDILQEKLEKYVRMYFYSSK
jgi:hypothetical protein